MQVQENSQLGKIEDFQEGWNTFGPIAMIIYMGAFFLVYGGIWVSFRHYKKHLRLYESNPANPVNVVA